MRMITHLLAGLLGAVGLAAIATGLLGGADSEEVVSTGVAAPPSSPDPPETSAPVEGDPPPSRLTCRNAELGFTLAYPEDWVVYTHDPERPCRFFSSTQIAPPPEGSNFPDAEIGVYLAQEPFRQLMGTLRRSGFDQVNRRLTVGNTRAVAIRYEQPDREGAGGYVYVLDLGTEPALYVEARESLSVDYATTMTVLDDIMGTWEFR